MRSVRIVRIVVSAWCALDVTRDSFGRVGIVFDVRLVVRVFGVHDVIEISMQLVKVVRGVMLVATVLQRVFGLLNPRTHRFFTQPLV